MESANSWQRKYVERSATVVALVLGVIFGVVGLGVLGLGLFKWGDFDGAWILLLVGLVFVIVGPSIAWYIYHFGEDIDIECGPNGFAVTQESRRAGKRHAVYTWREVTATNYREDYHRSRSSTKSNTQIHRYFSVETAQGQAFNASEAMSQFNDLISVFNQMTPHLPYTWTPQTGVSISLGLFHAARGAYTRTPREPADQLVAATAAEGYETASAVEDRPQGPPPPPPEIPPRNTLGLIGLIVSVVSLPLCGLLAPVGLLLSVIGFSKPNKGLAIAGTIVGALGTGLLVLVAYGVFAGATLVNEIKQTELTMDRASEVILAQRAVDAELPDDAAGQALIAPYDDYYGNPLRYTRLEEDRFELSANGKDGVAGTDDDLTNTYHGLPQAEATDANESGPVEIPTDDDY